MLVRFRVACFHQRKRTNSENTNQGNKRKRLLVASSMDPPPLQKRVALASTSPKVGTGFLHLMESITERKLPASADTRVREKGLLKFSSSGNETDAPVANVATLPIDPLPVCTGR